MNQQQASVKNYYLFHLSMANGKLKAIDQIYIMVVKSIDKALASVIGTTNKWNKQNSQSGKDLKILFIA